MKGLLALAGDEKVDAGVRSAAAGALGQLGRADEAVLKGLLALAGDEKVATYVRSDAAQALGQLGRVDEAGRFLLALVEAEKTDEAVQMRAFLYLTSTFRLSYSFLIVASRSGPTPIHFPEGTPRDLDHLYISLGVSW